MRLLARARGRRGLYPARCGGTSEAAMIPGPTGPTVVGRQTLLAHPLSSTRPAQALAVGAQLGHAEQHRLRAARDDEDPSWFLTKTKVHRGASSLSRRRR